MGDVLGFVGQIAGSAIQASAQEQATQAQMDAINQQRQYVFNNLNPATINAQASAADVQQTLSQLALQGQIDPALLATRQAAGQQILNQTNQIGQQSGQVANQAVSEALAPGAVASNKQALIDAALGQLKQGATLPPDVEAQLVQSGLEQTGMVNQNATAQGIGGNIQRQILGTAGINLQMQRQQQAAQLLTAAQNLETSRANVLQGLFPSLAQTQLSNLSAASGAFGTAQAAAPNVGLSGSNVANIWLARVGATNQLTQAAGNVQAQGAMAQGNIWGQAAGGATRAASPLANQLWSNITSPSTSGSSSSTDSSAGSSINDPGAASIL